MQVGIGCKFGPQVSGLGTSSIALLRLPAVVQQAPVLCAAQPLRIGDIPRVSPVPSKHWNATLVTDAALQTPLAPC